MDWSNMTQLHKEIKRHMKAIKQCTDAIFANCLRNTRRLHSKMHTNWEVLQGESQGRSLNTKQPANTISNIKKLGNIMIENKITFI